MQRASRPLRPWNLLVPLGLLTLFACTPHAVRPNVYRAWVNGFAFGLFGQREIDVRDVCASGAARRVSTRHSFATVSVTIVSLGLYTPRQIEVRCSE